MRLLELSVEAEPRRSVRVSWTTDALACVIIVCIRITFPLQYTHMQYAKKDVKGDQERLPNPAPNLIPIYPGPTVKESSRKWLDRRCLKTELATQGK